MPIESYFATHSKPKRRKINKRIRHTNENDPNDKGRSGYRDNYGL